MITCPLPLGTKRISPLELFEYIRKLYDSTKTEFRLPNPMFNVLNGGSHAFNSTDFQEYMVVPTGINDFEDSILAGFQIYNKLRIDYYCYIYDIEKDIETAFDSMNHTFCGRFLKRMVLVKIVCYLVQ